MSAESKLLMLGLRGSGKTTFLAALWHHLESAEMADDLSLPRLQPDRDYLNNIRDNWLALKPVGRTSPHAKGSASLALNDIRTNTEIDIWMPDLSGESFRQQWSTRMASEEYVDTAKQCAGAFLFIHPNEIRKTHALKPASEDRPNDGDDDLSARIDPSLNWTPEQSSSQVQLVDILQLLLRLREARRNMRVSVIVSAWDLISVRISPVGWLESRLPLLAQFLTANADNFDSAIFGISAQGGDLMKDRDRLTKSVLPSARCQAVEGDNIRKVAITAPLRFLLNSGDDKKLSDGLTH